MYNNDDDDDDNDSNNNNNDCVEAEIYMISQNLDYFVLFSNWTLP